MNKNEQFSTVFRKHGGSLPDSRTAPDVAEKAEKQIRFYSSIAPAIYVGIVENRTFNAIATRNNFGEFIALYSGALTQLTMYAYQLFSDPALCPDIGDVSIEKCEPQIIERLKSGDLAHAMTLRYMPFCPIRKSVSELIAESACLTLFLHEVAHIEGCHLDLIYDEMCLSEYQEINIHPLNEKESLLLRALELEADSLALLNSLAIWRNLAEHPTYHELQSFGATRSWLIATELLFFVMSFNHERARRKQLASHPSVLSRFFNIRLLRGAHGNEDEELINAVNDPRTTMLVHWVIKHELSSPMFEGFHEQSSESIEELTELKAHVETLWSRLEEYQYKRSQRNATGVESCNHASA